MSGIEVDERDEVIKDADGTGSSENARSEVDQQASDAEGSEEGGKLEEMVEDVKMEEDVKGEEKKNVNGTGSSENVKGKGVVDEGNGKGEKGIKEQEQEEGQRKENVGKNIGLEGEEIKKEGGNRESGHEKVGGVGCEKMEEEMEEKDEELEEAEEKEDDGEKRNRKNGSRGARARADADKERRRSRELLEEVSVSFSPDRPVRERKAVVRLVEIIEKQQDQGFHIEKGCGTQLKDIPNVARKLSKIKPEDLKLLHMILFGRKGKAADFKSHILRFSGFAWHENEEKQRDKVQEKLDKCTKDQLLVLCDVFNMPVSTTSARKEDMVEKLLDFVITPHATDYILLSKAKQFSSSRLKRKRSSRGIPPGSSPKHSGKRHKKNEDAVNLMEKDETEMEEEGCESEAEGNKENGISNGHGEARYSEHDEENKLNDNEDGVALKTRKNLKKRKDDISKSAKKSSSKKFPPSDNKLSPTASDFSKVKEMVNMDSKVFSRRKKVDPVSKKTPNSQKFHTNAKNTGKKLGKTKVKSGHTEDSSPSDEDVRKLTCQILKEVDFNTATFTDVLRLLSSRYNKDLTPRKESIKSMVKEELMKIAEEEVDEEDVEDESDDEIDENAQLGDKVL